MIKRQIAVGEYGIYPLTEYALTLEFGHGISTDIQAKISGFDVLLQKDPFNGFVSSVPSYTSLSIFYDPVQVMAHSRDKSAYETVCSHIRAMFQAYDGVGNQHQRTVNIPVCYGGDCGPDLEEVATMHGMTAETVIKSHSEAAYQVFLIGFTPGFAYLGGMEKTLASPRKSTPRNLVPAGSVGIAGQQTGIYSLDTPGGWQIIGRTPLRLFDPRRENPVLLNTGDRVRFEPINRQVFQQLYDEQYAD